MSKRSGGAEASPFFMEGHMNHLKLEKSGDRLSLLGYGCLRYTRKAGGSIDQEKAEAEMLAAYQGGVNYFDTAYIYPGSEAALGKFLKKINRKSVYIATKIPHYLIREAGDFNRYFEEQLKRLETDYIDYYLMHMLPDADTWARLKDLGIEEWVAAKKAAGQIRNIGFSFHGGTRNFTALIDSYDWDFCQIQYNYCDEHAQAGVAGLQYAAGKGIPVIIMEPLKGGRLANGLPKEAQRAFLEAAPGRSFASWGFRWLYRQKEVCTVLSGMNDLAQVEDNLATASLPREEMLTDAEMDVIRRVKAILEKDVKIGCTGCGYCLPCPAGVDIPVCFRAYNNVYTLGWYMGMKEYMMCTTLKSVSTAAGNCIGCGQCETRCPQGLPIRQELQKVRKKLETPLYKLARWAAKKKYKM